MKLQNKKGFTLIELLVVIAIIWILATWWVNIFTKQLQWARDTKRMQWVKLLETANQQYFTDYSEYPDDTSTWAYMSWVLGYVSNFPKDPKPGSSICWNSWATATANNTPCWVWYWRMDDINSLTNARFKLATSFEKKENATKTASDDSWTIWGYYEAFGWEWGSGTTLNRKLY